MNINTNQSILLNDLHSSQQSDEEKALINKFFIDFSNNTNKNIIKSNLSSLIKEIELLDPEKFIHVTQAVHEILKQHHPDPKINEHFTHLAVDMIAKRGIAHYEPTLISHPQEHTWLRIELVIKLITSRKSSDPLELIKKYKIPSDATTYDGTNAFVAIGKAAYAMGCYNVLIWNASHLASLGLNSQTLEGQKVLIDLVKLASCRYDKHDEIHHYITDIISSNIKSFGIDASTELGQQALIEIAKEVVNLDEMQVANFIQDFGIDPTTSQGKQGLIDIAKLVAGKYMGNISKYIRNFKIDSSTDEGQNALIEIVRLAIQHQYLPQISKNIHNFEIDASSAKGNLALVEFAKILAGQDDELSENIQNFAIDASSALMEIAKIAVQHYPTHTSKYIKNYAIDALTSSGQIALIEIAMLAAASQNTYRGGISEYIQNFGIDSSTPEGKKALLEIAKLAAQQPNSHISKYIQNYGIDNSTLEGQKALIEIAKYAAQFDGEETSILINNYGIDNSTPDGQKALIEIAKRAAQNKGKETSIHIKNYGIDPSTENGQQGLIEIAMLAAQQNGEGTSRNIANYNIDPSRQQALIEIAKLAAQQNGLKTSEFIKNYGIDSTKPEGQAALVDIAKQAIKSSGSEVIKYIGNYSISVSTEEGQKALIKLAILAAASQKRDQSFFYYNFNDFGINPSTKQGQIGLIKIAKAAAQIDAAKLSSNIKMFGIDKSTDMGQQGLIEIAKLAANQNGHDTSNYIKLYGIYGSTEKGQQALIEIAELASQGFSLCETIQNYGIDSSRIDGQKALSEIAKKDAQRNGEKTSQYIKNYGLDFSTPSGKKVKIEIAKLAAQQNGGGTSKYIHKYGFDPVNPEDKKALIDIAMLSARQEGMGVSQYIKNYGLDPANPEDKKALVAIAMLAAQENGSGVSLYIKNYGFNPVNPEDKKALIDIAKVSAQQIGSGISEHIENYGFDPSNPEDKKALIDIAMLTAQQNNNELSKHIKNYGLDPANPEDKKALIDIVKLAAKDNIEETLENIENYGLGLSKPEGQELCEKLSNYLFMCALTQMENLSPQSVATNFKFFVPEKFFGEFRYHSCEDFIKLGLEMSKDNIDDIAKRYTALCKTTFGFIPSEMQNKLNKADPFVKKNLLQESIALAALCTMQNDLQSIFTKDQTLLRTIFQMEPRLRVLLSKEIIRLSINNTIPEWKLLDNEANAHAKPFCLVMANLLAEQTTPGEPIHKETILKLIQQLNTEKEFKEKQKQKILYHTLIAISESQLAKNKKIELIDRLFSLPLEQRLIALGLVRDLLAYKGETYIQDTIDLNELSMALEMLFRMKFDTHIDNFTDKYQKNIRNWRKHELLMTYVSNLLKLPFFEREMAMDLFKKIINAILGNSFLTTRYETQENPHLEAIKNTHPFVFEKWKQRVELSKDEMKIPSQTQAPEIPITEKTINNLKQALQEKHLGPNQAELYPHITACIGNWALLNESLQRISTELIPLSKRHLSSDEASKKKQLLMQKQILKLFKENNADKMATQLQAIKSLVPVNTEFYNNVNDAIKFLTTPIVEPTKIQVLETDDPNHILLMGTEVLNSCQSIYGSPALNKCLLGYFLDGKHRLCLVCDQKGNILARSVLRLLINDQNQPVLYLEKVYEAFNNPEHYQLLKKVAIKKAALLGIPLVSCSFHGAHYPHVLYAKEKPVPFEYVDALQNIQPGPYTIENVRLLSSESI